MNQDPSSKDCSESGATKQDAVVDVPSSKASIASGSTNPDAVVDVRIVPVKSLCIRSKPDLTKINHSFFNQHLVGKHLQAISEGQKLTKYSEPTPSSSFGSSAQIPETKGTLQPEVISLSGDESDGYGFLPTRRKRKWNKFTHDECKTLLRALINEGGQRMVSGNLIWKNISFLKVSVYKLYFFIHMCSLIFMVCIFNCLYCRN